MRVDGEGDEGQGEVSADDIFANTFAELSSEGGVEIDDGAGADVPGATGATGAAPPVETPGATGTVGDLPDPAVVAAEAEARRAAGATGAPPPAPAGATGATGATGPAPKPIEDVLRGLLEERENKPAPKPAPETAPDPYKVPDYTAEQKEVVDAYIREFPEMARAEEIIRSREYHGVTSYIFKQVGGVIEQQAGRIKQLEDLVGSMAGVQQANSIEAEVGGKLSEYKPKIDAWIKEQPDFIRPAYERIAKEGNHGEVVGLIKAWQKATGTVVAGPTGATGAAPTVTGATGATGTVLVPPKPKPKVPAGMRPVQGVRSQPADTTIARDDYEGAFAAFAKAAE